MIMCSINGSMVRGICGHNPFPSTIVPTDSLWVKFALICAVDAMQSAIVSLSMCQSWQASVLYSYLESGVRMVI